MMSYGTLIMWSLWRQRSPCRLAGGGIMAPPPGGPPAPPGPFWNGF